MYRYTPEDIAQALERLAPRMLYLDRSLNPEQAQQQFRESLSLVELMAFICAKGIESTGGDEVEAAERAAAGLNKLLAAGIDPERLAVEVQESIGSLEPFLCAEPEA